MVFAQNQWITHTKLSTNQSPIRCPEWPSRTAQKSERGWKFMYICSYASRTTAKKLSCSWGSRLWLPPKVPQKVPQEKSIDVFLRQLPALLATFRNRWHLPGALSMSVRNHCLSGVEMLLIGIQIGTSPQNQQQQNVKVYNFPKTLSSKPKNVLTGIYSEVFLATLRIWSTCSGELKNYVLHLKYGGTTTLPSKCILVASSVYTLKHRGEINTSQPMSVFNSNWVN